VAAILFYPAVFFKHYFVPQGDKRLLLCVPGILPSLESLSNLASSFASLRLCVRYSFTLETLEAQRD
jgi:hypothetical protein